MLIIILLISKNKHFRSPKSLTVVQHTDMMSKYAIFISSIQNTNECLTHNHEMQVERSLGNVCLHSEVLINLANVSSLILYYHTS